ncbi:hypothetical protein PAKAF_02879 [Pseudomonas aeruginosa PAK]|nr:hypothetical protein PAKAF_02879 [Pseudomonas aeruginosa PAK]
MHGVPESGYKAPALSDPDVCQRTPFHAAALDAGPAPGSCRLRHQAPRQSRQPLRDLPRKTEMARGGAEDAAALGRAGPGADGDDVPGIVLQARRPAAALLLPRFHPLGPGQLRLRLRPGQGRDLGRLQARGRRLGRQPRRLRRRPGLHGLVHPEEPAGQRRLQVGRLRPVPELPRGLGRLPQPQLRRQAMAEERLAEGPVPRLAVRRPVPQLPAGAVARRLVLVARSAHAAGSNLFRLRRG